MIVFEEERDNARAKEEEYFMMLQEMGNMISYRQIRPHNTDIIMGGLGDLSGDGDSLVNRLVQQDVRGTSRGRVESESKRNMSRGKSRVRGLLCEVPSTEVSSK